MSDWTGADAFANRYRARDPLKGIQPERIAAFFNSTAYVVANEVLRSMISGYDAVRYDMVNQAIDVAHQETCMELGKAGLFRYQEDRFAVMPPSQIDVCCNYLVDARQPGGERFSFLETLLACCARQLQYQWPRIERRLEQFLRSNSLPLDYADLLFRPLDAGVLEEEIHEPFWELIEDAAWANVRQDMQMAFAQRDSGGPDPGFYAARALESAIKVISKLKGWNRGKESGAAGFIDNLVSQTNGRFIEVWEGDILKGFFGKVRNPTAHGAGDAEQPKLSVHQTNWTIEFCMIWVKSLIKRM